MIYTHTNTEEKTRMFQKQKKKKNKPDMIKFDIFIFVFYTYFFAVLIPFKRYYVLNLISIYQISVLNSLRMAKKKKFKNFI